MRGHRPVGLGSGPEIRRWARVKSFRSALDVLVGAGALRPSSIRRRSETGSRADAASPAPRAPGGLPPPERPSRRPPRTSDPGERERQQDPDLEEPRAAPDQRPRPARPTAGPPTSEGPRTGPGVPRKEGDHRESGGDQGADRRKRRDGGHPDGAPIARRIPLRATHRPDPAAKSPGPVRCPIRLNHASEPGIGPGGPSRLASYAENDLPHEQVCVAFGL